MASLPDKFRYLGLWDAVSIGVGGMVGGPRAYLIAVDFVVILYVVISLMTLETLSFNQIADAKDYALEAAARPLFGKFGFVCK